MIMKKTVLIAALTFWCLMIGLVIAGKQQLTDDRTVQVAQVVSSSQALAAKQYTMKEVAPHATAKDCWMVISGNVYDFSTYISQHPSAPAVMTRHCGKEATRAFASKDLGRPHSDYAKSLLANYLKGTLGK